MSKLKTSLASLCLSVSLVTPLFGLAFWSAPDSGFEKKTQVGAKINLNEVDLQGLLRVQGLGKTRAKAIVAYRHEHGPYLSVEGLRKVRGIGKALFDKIAGHFSVAS